MFIPNGSLELVKNLKAEMTSINMVLELFSVSILLGFMGMNLTLQKKTQLAEKDSTGFISLLRTVSPSNYTDGLHPDIKGQSGIAAKVWKSLTRNYLHL
jgi:lysophospholipase L1-like esterase